MKRSLKLSLLSLLVVSLVTGCGMKAEYGIKIDKNEKVSLEFLVAQDDEMIDAMIDMGDSVGEETATPTETKKHTDKERWEYLESDEEEEGFEGFEKVKYEKDGYKGYTYKLELGKIDELVSDSDEAIDFDSIGEDAKIFTKKGNVYKLNVKASEEETTQMEEYADQIDFDVKLKVTLPYKAKSNDATKVDGTTYIWDLTKAKSINLEFTLDGSSEKNNNVMIIAGCACAVVAIGIGVVVVLKKKKQA